MRPHCPHRPIIRRANEDVGRRGRVREADGVDVIGVRDDGEHDSAGLDVDDADAVVTAGRYGFIARPAWGEPGLVDAKVTAVSSAPSSTRTAREIDGDLWGPSWGARSAGAAVSLLEEAAAKIGEVEHRAHCGIQQPR